MMSVAAPAFQFAAVLDEQRPNSIDSGLDVLLAFHAPTHAAIVKLYLRDPGSKVCRRRSVLTIFDFKSLHDLLGCVADYQKHRQHRQVGIRNTAVRHGNSCGYKRQDQLELVRNLVCSL